MSVPLLAIENLTATVEGKEVLKGVSLSIKSGEVHVLMGPNGSGKSSLAMTVFGHPNYTVTSGSITFDGHDVLAHKTHERARLGMFFAMQSPVALPGITVANLLRTASKNLRGDEPFIEFRKRVQIGQDALKMDASFLERSAHDGFSGGEKKLTEMLQLTTVEPKLAILDEPDSGLDIDALKRIADVVNRLRDGKRSFLIITHYQRLLNYIKPDAVHVFRDGCITNSGGSEIAKELENTGYGKQ